MVLNWTYLYTKTVAIKNMGTSTVTNSVRTGIAAKYGYTQEQVSAYWQGVEDAQYEYTKTMLCAAAKVASDAVEHDKSIRND